MANLINQSNLVVSEPIRIKLFVFLKDNSCVNFMIQTTINTVLPHRKQKNIRTKHGKAIKPSETTPTQRKQ